MSQKLAKIVNPNSFKLYTSLILWLSCFQDQFQKQKYV